MSTLPKISLEALVIPKNFQDLQKKLRDIIVFDEVEYALWFYRNIIQAISQPASMEAQYRDIVSQYQIMASQAGWVALPALTDQEATSLFKGRLKIGLALDEVPIDDKFRAKLINILIYEDRDKFKEEIKRTLYGSMEIITQTDIIVDNRQYKGTCLQWYREFLKHGGETQVNKIKLSQFLSSDRNVLRLTRMERISVERLFKIFERVRLSSLTLEGLEETIPIDDRGREGVIRNGRYERLRPGELKTDLEIAQKVLNWPSSRTLLSTTTPQLPVKKPTNPMETLKQKYQFYRQQRERLLNLEDRIMVSTKGDSESIKRALATATRQNNKNQVIACLILLAQQGALVNALRDNPAWFEAVAEYLQNKYAKFYPSQDITVAISNIKFNPTAPPAIVEFLQYLLMEKLKMTENDSALVGVEISQILGGQYQALAYGNQETGNFEWGKNKIVGNSLVSEA